MASFPRVQLWNLVPVTSALADGLFPAPPGKETLGPSFDARVEDEALKVNAQLLGYLTGGDLKIWQRTQALYQLVCDAKWDPLFDRQDDRGNKTSREDLLIHLRDWVDENERTSDLSVAAGSAATCGLVVRQPPFVDAFGDENQLYDRGEDRYRAKNAYMDSLEELYLVAGIGDAFMAAFQDNLTVYLALNAKQNVNTTDRQRILLNARLIADQPLDPLLQDPTFADRLVKAMMERTLGGILSITPRDFAVLVGVAGLKTNAALLGTGTGTGPNDALTDRSDTFRIRAKGTAGTVTTGIDAVVRMDSPQQTMGQPMAAPGRLVHWREE
jgi:general secretion pathway protein K